MPAPCHEHPGRGRTAVAIDGDDVALVISGDLDSDEYHCYHYSRASALTIASAIIDAVVEEIQRGR